MRINFDNKFLQAMSDAFDAVWLAFLWMLCSLPIVTMGAAATAVFSVHLGVDRQTGSVTLRFFRAFRANIRQTLCIQLILLAAAGVLAADVYICWSGEMPETVQTVTRMTTLLLAIVTLGIMSCIYGVAAKLVVSIKQAFYDVLYIAVKKPLCVFGLMALTVLAALSAASLLAFSVLPLGLIFYLQAKLFERIFRAVMPQVEEDKMEIMNG